MKQQGRIWRRLYSWLDPTLSGIGPFLYLVLGRPILPGLGRSTLSGLKVIDFSDIFYKIIIIMRLRLKREGFTLLELMISAAIILVTLVGLIETYVACLRLNEISKNENLALQATQSVMEAIRKTPGTQFSQIYTNYHNTTYDVPGIASGEGTVCVRINDSTANGTLFDVAVGACWQQGNGIIGGCNESLIFSDPDAILNSSVNLRAMMSQR